VIVPALVTRAAPARSSPAPFVALIVPLLLILAAPLTSTPPPPSMSPLLFNVPLAPRTMPKSAAVLPFESTSPSMVSVKCPTFGPNTAASTSRAGPPV